MSKHRPIPVTDHAVLRHLERSGLVDVVAIRAALGRAGAIAVAHGAKYVVTGRVKLVVVDGVVVTVLGRDMLESRAETYAIAKDVVSLQGIGKIRRRRRRG